MFHPCNTDVSSIPDESVLLFVMTTPGHSEQRRHIRETWCGECNRVVANCRCIFILGVARNVEDSLLLNKEAETERDILQVDMVESYNNLTLKTIHAVRCA